jgi:Mg-chelatase subunit ChlD
MTDERLRRWRLILGGDEADGTNVALGVDDTKRDAVLSALYDSQRKGGLGASAPSVSRWLGDIRTYFPSSVVQVMQKDALERLGLNQMLLEPESLRAVQPDVHLVATLMNLSRAIPAKTRDTARQVVGAVVADLEKRLASPLRQAVTGALSRSVRNNRPRLKEIDWDRTIRANMKHYQAEYRTIVPERRIGFGRKGQALKDIILVLDQSGSMANSVVYAGVFGAVLATLKSVRTSVVAFDTSVVDLTDTLHDPVELLFSVQLGGGTDIERALAYCQGLVRVPSDTIMVLISDLIEGGNGDKLVRRAGAIRASGVNLIALLALSDEGEPMVDRDMAARFAALDVPSFACTPDQFPELMATAIKGQDVGEWASRNVK